MGSGQQGSPKTMTETSWRYSKEGPPKLPPELVLSLKVLLIGVLRNLGPYLLSRWNAARNLICPGLIVF